MNPHGEKEQLIDDKHRQREIMDVTDFQEIRIKAYSRTKHKALGKGNTNKIKSLKQIKFEVDEIVDLIRTKKRKLIALGKFVPWDPKKKFDPKEHIRRGYIDVSDNVVFENHRDTLRCFGYKKKGHFQRASWRIPGTEKQVWFPKLYKNKDWDNELNENFDTITEKYIGTDTEKMKWIVQPRNITKNIVFAHYKNFLGRVVYKFLGEFHVSLEESNSQQVVYKRTSTRVKLP